MNEYHLNQTLSNLRGPTKEQIIVNNQWAAVAFNKFHQNSKTKISISIDGDIEVAIIKWDSNFSDSAMKEKIDMANHGGVAMALFLMSVLLKYGYVEQSEIGDGVDYRFKKDEPGDDNLNFFDDFHYVEISGVLTESTTNTLKGRLKIKHNQIIKGGKSDKPSSVIVTLFSEPKTVKEHHN